MSRATTQERVLAYIRYHIARHKIGPSNPEIGRALGLEQGHISDVISDLKELNRLKETGNIYRFEVLK